MKALNQRIKNSVRLQPQQLEGIIPVKERKPSIVDSMKNFLTLKLFQKENE